MKVKSHHFNSSGFLPQDSLAGVRSRLKRLLAKDDAHHERPSYWQVVLLQSKVNGCSYHGEDLPHSNWKWPKNTWFQERLSGRAKEFDLQGEAFLDRHIDRLQNQFSLPNRIL